ncbi:MAG: aminotransferase class V-fold PLP-dependent enzyme [Syntrophobacteraceae bacterium]
MSVYLDNAATSFPKPPEVVGAVSRALECIGASPGRGAHRHAREAMSIMAQCRERAARVLGVSDPDRVIFTRNATESINVVLKGFLRPGDRVLISGMEHNAVVRPLQRLASQGVTTEIIPTGAGGEIDAGTLETMLGSKPALVVLVHASNVNGALMPVAEAAELCARSGVPLLVDAAQSAGIQPICAGDLGLGMVACSAHKALLGPAGVGILYIRPDIEISPLIEGGTGSRSEDFNQPEFCPDRFESGTPNLPGLAGLSEGIDFLFRTGIDHIREHEFALAAMLENKLSEISGVRVLSPRVRGTGTVSFVASGMNPADIGFILDEAFDIAVRTGLHCAPLAHRTLGTFPEGTVRVSPGYSTTEDEVEYFLKSLRSILEKGGR